METLKDSDLESLTRFAEDLAKYKLSAAKALKKFETAYIDVIGHDDTSENNMSSDIQQRSTEISDLSSSNTDNSIASNRTFNVKSHQSIFNPMDILYNTACFHCHKCMPSSKTPYKSSSFDWRFVNLDKDQGCSNCANNNDYIFSHDDEIFVERHYPMSNNVKPIVSFYNNSLNITVPEPFHMTIREENTKYIKEQKIQKLKEELKEKSEKEMRVKIHSNPAPAHIYVPLYKKMTELNLARREMRRQKSVERTKEITKPFNMLDSERLRRSDSMPNLQAEGKHYQFKAKPVPKAILSSKINEKLKTKEIIRQARIAERAKEMLIHSSLPFTSDRSLKRSLSSVTLKRKEHEKCNNRKTYKTETNVTSEESRKIMVDWNKKVKKVVCQKNHNLNHSQEVNNVTSKERYRKFLKSREKPLDHCIRMTEGAILRENEIRKEVTSRNTYNVDSNDQYKNEIKQQIRKKLHDVVPLNYQKDIELKLKSYRIARQQRQIEYEQELKEIQKRIAKQPLLVERQSKTKLLDEKKDKSTNTEPIDFENQTDDNSNKTLSSGSSLGSNNSDSNNDDDSVSDDLA